jgi:ferredoxin-thioredoxin reductase catalytic subunit
MNSTNNNSFEIAAKKVFLQLEQLIEEDEKLNNYHVNLHELPNDIMEKINNNLLDKNDKRFNKIFNDSKDYKLLKILFGNNIPSRKQLKYIDPNIYNEYKTNINLDCIKEYINKNKKFNKLNCHSLQIVYRVNSSINFLSFLIRLLDENNNKIGSINSSCKVSFKFKDKDKEEFLCNKECQNVISNINNEIKNSFKYIK